MIPTIDPISILFGAGGALAALIAMHAGTQRAPAKDPNGSARWASWRDLKRAKLDQGKGLLLGRDRRAKAGMLGLQTDTHLLTVAPTRSGKGVSAIIPNLLSWRGSVLVIDPKGENAAVTAGFRRSLGQEIALLDPWHLIASTSASFNPFDWLDPQSPDIADDAALIADALIQDSDGTGTYWDREAAALMTGLILYIAHHEPPEQRHLPRLRELLTLEREAFAELLIKMSLSTKAGGLIARASARLSQKGEKEFSLVLSAAQSHSHFLDSPRMAAVLTGSSFAPADLKRRPMSVFLIIPPDRLPTYSRWLRLMVSITLTALIRERGQQGRPVLFILDEFAALGRMDAIRQAMGLLAGYGVQLWPICQDFSQLKTLYGEGWTSFIANAGVIQAFAVNDNLTAKALSERLGSQSIAIHATSGREGEAGARTISQAGRPLMFPDEIMRMDPAEQLLLLRVQPPIKGRKLVYFKDKPFKGLYGPNPMLQPNGRMKPAANDNDPHAGEQLPPPATSFLSYAIKGWVAQWQDENGKDEPPPEQAVWAQDLAAILESDDWRTQTADLVRRGFDELKMDQTFYALIDPAFKTPGFRARLRRALEVWL